MRTRIVPGAEVDVPTTAEVGQLIVQAFEAQRQEMYRREKSSIVLDGTGAGTTIFKLTRLYDWVCERVTISAGAGGAVEFYENQVADTDLLEDITLNARGRYSDSFSNNLFIPAGSQLFVVFAGAGNNGLASVNLQVRLIRATG